MAGAIVTDVARRNLGFQPPGHVFTLNEYGLLYLTSLAVPWLVRARGHVQIELLTAAIRPRAPFWLICVVYARSFSPGKLLHGHHLQSTFGLWCGSVSAVSHRDGGPRCWRSSSATR
jgi:hypothetical protein